MTTALAAAVSSDDMFTNLAVDQIHKEATTKPRAEHIFINELERARSEHSTRLFCTYDCQRAFDSPSKNAQKLGWVGVPADFTEFIVGLEEGGKTAVRTPYSANIYNHRDWTALKTRMNTVSVALFMPNVALPKVTYPAPSVGLLSMISF